MKFRFDSDLWDQVDKLVPNVIFGQDLGALHFKACMQEFHWDLLVCGKLVNLFNVKLILE
jgi:hypothetical protein